jgi:hypothetical protein
MLNVYEIKHYFCFTPKYNFMKKVLIFAGLFIFSHIACAQGSLTIINTNPGFAAQITMNAQDPTLTTVPCQIIGNVVYLVQYGFPGATYSATDACAFETATGWSYLSGPTTFCPAPPATFQWTDAAVVLKPAGGCVCATCSETTVYVGNAMLMICNPSAVNAVTGSVGTCTYTVSWHITMTGVEIDITP